MTLPKTSEWNDCIQTLESGVEVQILPTDKEYVWCWGRYGDEACNLGFEGYYDHTRGQWYAHNNGTSEGMYMPTDYKATVIKWHYLPEKPE